MAEVKRYGVDTVTPIKNEDSSLNANKNVPSLRQGDWICVSCNNLNFSFRTVCNRCKTQTRQTNYFNYMIQNQSITTISCFTLTDSKKNPQVEYTQPNKQWAAQQKAKPCNQPSKSVKVFENALLLTPTKDQDRNPNTDQPYRSPFKLPSVSPLLKKFTDSKILEKYGSGNNDLQQRYSKTHAKIIDFGKYSTPEVKQEDNDAFQEQIDRLLGSIQM